MPQYKKLLPLILTLIVVLSIFSGCSSSKKEKPEAKQQGTQQQGDKIPEDLTSMENGIESIFLALNGPAVMETKGGGQQGGQQRGQQAQQGGGQKSQSKDQSTQEKTGEGTQKGGSESQSEKTQQGSQGDQENKSDKKGQESKSSQGGQQGGQGQQQGQQTQMTMQQDPWKQLDPVINKLHYQWNSYMPSAVRQGANRTLVDSFGAALNNLTNTIIVKNKTNALLAASNLYAYIPDFYSLYRTSTSPEIKRIRHYIRNAVLNSSTANWSQAETDMKNAAASWSMYKNMVNKDQQEDASKLDFSIYELAKVISDKNQPLTDIKGRISLSNVQALEKAQEKTSGGGGGSSGGGSSEGGSSGGGSSGGSSGGGSSGGQS